VSTAPSIAAITRRVRGLARGIRSRFEPTALTRRIRTRPAGTPLRIVIGASGVFDHGWIDTNAGELNLLKPRDWKHHFRRDSIDAILAEHVWEHLTVAEGLAAANQCFAYLRPGGYLRVAVPDGFHPDPAYIEWVKVGGVGAGADDHKVLYTCESFVPLFEMAGFTVELLEHHDNQGRFHFRDWNTEDGTIHRSRRFDARNAGGELKYTSLILDAHKPLVKWDRDALRRFRE
jgi:predicted SAM-dependent methyltransferase